VNVRDFLDIRVICGTGSLRKAAVVLGVTQPTLSNRVAHLEDQLGSSLFDRSRGQSEPTDLALFIARRSTVMADEAERLSQEIRRVSSGKAGLVRIGTSPVPARALLPDIAVEISEQYPNISLEFLTAPTSQLADDLIQRKLDLLICPALEQVHDAVVSDVVLETKIVAVARPDHPLCVTPPATILGLFKYPIALPTTERHYIDEVRQSMGIDLESMAGRVICSDPGMLARIVQKSPRLFTAAPEFYFAPELDTGVLRIIDVMVPMGHTLYLHRNRDAFPLPAVTKVQQMLFKAFAALRDHTAARAHDSSGK
jgi:DNA-binding transcriptional LysR family regulator